MELKKKIGDPKKTICQKKLMGQKRGGEIQLTAIPQWERGRGGGWGMGGSWEEGWLKKTTHLRKNRSGQINLE